MTKVTILGEAQGAEPEKKKIEFVNASIGAAKWSAAGCSPSDYKNIELLALDYTEGFDLMFAFDSIRSNGSLYLGHFNDGIV